MLIFTSIHELYIKVTGECMLVKDEADSFVSACVPLAVTLYGAPHVLYGDDL